MKTRSDTKWTIEHLEKLKAAGTLQGYNDTTKKTSNAFALIAPAAGRRVAKVFSTKSPAKDSTQQQAMAFAHGLGLEFWSEYRFHPTRRWRFDWAIDPKGLKIAVEFEGGLYDPHGPHRATKHIQKDIEKYNAATLLGWKVLRVTSKTYQQVTEQLKSFLNPV